MVQNRFQVNRFNFISVQATLCYFAIFWQLKAKIKTSRYILNI